MGERQHAPPKGRRWKCRHGAGVLSGKGNLPTGTARTLDSDSGKWFSCVATHQERLPRRRRFGGLFLCGFSRFGVKLPLRLLTSPSEDSHEESATLSIVFSERGNSLFHPVCEGQPVAAGRPVVQRDGVRCRFGRATNFHVTAPIVDQLPRLLGSLDWRLFIRDAAGDSIETL